jgi:ABC-type Mn2+/Zn2+ transport system permease subunit
VAGVLISAFWDVPSGPAIVLLATTVFFLSILVSPKKLKRTASAHAH